MLMWGLTQFMNNANYTHYLFLIFGGFVTIWCASQIPNQVLMYI